ncbi:hypothetical protein B0H19DRAFT_1255341 [Mycena capillaripes]|nr:hypothetical protein B0H19DRAFT_1255341 [Mycena capillaripes]
MSTIDIQHQVNTNYYLNLVSFSVLFYDYGLSFGDEVSRFWGLPATAPNVLFFLNRYGICGYLHSYHQYFAVVTQIIIGIMLILRTYALYERNRRVLALMVFVASGVIAVGAWSVIAGPKAKAGDEVPQLPLYIGCSSGISPSQSIGLVAAWAGMGVFDATIFLLTLYRALSRRRTQGLDLVTVLLRDGSIYFGVIVMANLSNILTFVFAAPYTRGVPTTFTNSISSVMISRLMLNLRDPTLSTMFGRLTRTETLTGNGMFSTYLTRAAPGELDTEYVSRDIELQDRL